MAEAVEVCIGVMHEIGVGLIGAKGVMWLSVGLEVGLRQIGTLALLTQKDCTRRRTSIFFLSSIARKRIVTKVR